MVLANHIILFFHRLSSARVSHRSVLEHANSIAAPEPLYLSLLELTYLSIISSVAKKVSKVH